MTEQGRPSIRQLESWLSDISPREYMTELLSRIPYGIGGPPREMTLTPTEDFRAIVVNWGGGYEETIPIRRTMNAVLYDIYSMRDRRLKTDVEYAIREWEREHYPKVEEPPKTRAWGTRTPETLEQWLDSPEVLL